MKALLTGLTFLLAANSFAKPAKVTILDVIEDGSRYELTSEDSKCPRSIQVNKFQNEVTFSNATEGTSPEIEFHFPDINLGEKTDKSRNNFNYITKTSRKSVATEEELRFESAQKSRFSVFSLGKSSGGLMATEKTLSLKLVIENEELIFEHSESLNDGNPSTDIQCRYSL